jgi:DNA replication initiation complex subunit (GINS family)
MIDYLSKARLQLTETAAEESLSAELLTREIQNLEFMLKDMLLVRRDKIIRDTLLQKRPVGSMTVSEEEFYNRLLRAAEGHSEFLEETLSGRVSRALSDTADGMTSPDEGKAEYVMVRFLRAIDTAFVGIDEATYGPFSKEDIAVIPADNARPWLRDGTVMRVVAEGLERRG